MKLPSDDNVEKALLGTALLDSSALTKVLELDPQDFFYNNNRKTFDRIRDHYKKGLPIDNLTVSDSDVQDAGYLDYHTNDVDGYIAILKEKRKIRNIIHACHATIQQAGEGADAEYLVSQLGGVIQDAHNVSHIKDMSSMLMEVVKRIDDIRVGEQQLGITTGLDFDKPLGGFENGNFYVIAARPAMGKSAFALEVAKRTATHGVPVGIMSLEMSATSLALRLLTSDAGIDAQDLRKGKISQEEMEKVVGVAEKLSNLPIYFDDNSYVTSQSLRSRAHTFAQRHGIGMLVIDYLQLMTGNNDNRERDIAEASRTCKVIAKELEIPVIGLAQLNRGVEQRQNKRPMLSDLRESGAIEQDADVVMMLYRPEYYEQHYYGEQDPEEYRNQSTENICEVIIAKNRNGDIGGIRQVFIKNLMRFENRANKVSF